MRDQTSTYNRPPTSRPESRQSAQHGIIAPPPPPFNDINHDLSGPFGSSASFTPAGLPGHSDNGLIAGTDFTFSNSIGNNPLDPYETPTNNNPYELMNHTSYGSNQATYGTQSKRRREGGVNHQGRPAATFDAAVPDTMLT